MIEALDKIEASLAGKSPVALAKIDAELLAMTGHMKWIPSPGPQMAAYTSKADVLLYGGEPGGGKSQLILGLAFNCHQKSLLMRRQYNDLSGASGLVETALKIHGSRNGYNGSPPPTLKASETCSIDFGGANLPGDEQRWMGRAHDFFGADEATQFTELQIRFLMGWVRSPDPKQRCRVVLATNPPLSSEGLWVHQMFAPWIDPTFPNPAKDGELRWVVTDADGKDQWVDGPEPVQVGDKLMRPKSRTYIHSSVKDNPFYGEDYQATLDAMPEPYRSLLLGGFATTFKDAPNQIIPTDWIRQAQARWTPYPPHGVPMCAIGVDPSGGGDDPLAMAPRHDGWFAKVIEIPAKQIPKDRYGSHAAAMVMTHRRDRCLIVLDMGGGYGGGCYEILKENQIETRPYKGAEKSVRRTRDKQLGFFNVRSEALWRLREALDPDQPGGSEIALPDDPVLVADLTAPTLDMDYRGIKAESKEEVCKRLGRSTNRGDAVIMSWFDGPKAITHGDDWRDNFHRGKRVPRVIMGRQHDRH